jgi:hypothetical protein
VPGLADGEQFGVITFVMAARTFGIAFGDNALGCVFLLPLSAAAKVPPTNAPMNARHHQLQ